MKMAHPVYFEAVEITDENPQTLVIENNQLFRKAVLEMKSQCEISVGDYILSQDNATMNFEKNTVLITDPFTTDFEQRQLKTKLNQLLIEEIDYDHLLTTINKLNETAVMISNTSRYPLTFNMDINAGDIIKLLNFQIDALSFEDTERILEYINISSELLGKKLVILIGIKDILNAEEYSDFIEMIVYRKIHLLMLEHRQHDYDDINHLRIIDSDLCVI